MSRVAGVLTLFGAIWLAAWPPADRAFGQPIQGSIDSAQRLRRDLGEKGQIVIESLDLDNVDIEDVIRFLASVAGINIITGDLSGAVTVYLENVTVQDAFEAILASQGYGFILDGNIVRVVDAAQLGEDRVETVTEVFNLNYLSAQKVASTLQSVFQGGGRGGASYGQIEANVEANAIIAVDIPRRMEDIRRLIHFLDRRFEQVEIEGRFIEVSYEQDQDWGVDWRFFTDPANTFDVNLAPQPLNANNVAGQFKWAVINGDTNFTGFIQMLESQDDIKILASPKILAIENEEAEIALINEEPFVEANISQGVITESVQFQETGIRLLVTPTVAQEEAGTYVTMRLELEQRIRGPNVVLQNSVAFPIDSRRALTTLVVPDESTVIIGGLKSEALQHTYEKVPFLGSIPLFGFPFRRRQKSNDQRELILFVTPRVIYDHPPLDKVEWDLYEDLDHSMDALNRQSRWRERVEAPITMIDKGILYSAEVKNPDTYDRIEQVKDCIEDVKPYRISKPKGERRIHILGDETGIQEETEYVDEEKAAGPESEQPEEVEVRDFSMIEEKAGKAEGASGAGWNNPERRAEREEAPSSPPSPPPSQPEATPPSQEPKSDRPSWLRRGARNTSRDRRSDAGGSEGWLDEIEVEADEALADTAWEVQIPEPDALSDPELDQLLQAARAAREDVDVASIPLTQSAPAVFPEEAPVEESELGFPPTTESLPAIPPEEAPVEEMELVEADTKEMKSVELEGEGSEIVGVEIEKAEVVSNPAPAPAPAPAFFLEEAPIQEPDVDTIEIEEVEIASDPSPDTTPSQPSVEAVVVETQIAEVEVGIAEIEEADLKETEISKEDIAETVLPEEPTDDFDPWGIEAELVSETAPLKLDEPVATDPWSPLRTEIVTEEPNLRTLAPPQSEGEIPVGAILPAPARGETPKVEPVEFKKRPPPQRIVLSETLKALEQPKRAKPKQTDPTPKKASVHPEPKPQIEKSKVETKKPKVEKVDLRASTLGLEEPPEMDFRKYLDLEVLASMERLYSKENRPRSDSARTAVQVIDPFAPLDAIDPWEVSPGPSTSIAYPGADRGSRLLAQNQTPGEAPRGAPLAQLPTPRTEVPAARSTAAQPQSWWRRFLDRD